MNRSEAIAKLQATRKLTTDMLAPLNIKMDSFLRLAQRTPEEVEALTTALIDMLTAEQQEREDLRAVSDGATERG